MSTNRYIYFYPSKIPTIILCIKYSFVFISQVSYTGNDDPKHKNMVRIRILIPHYDGLLPVISTKELSNFGLILSSDVSRSRQHLCSNLLKPGETKSKLGFVVDKDTIFTSQPYENDVIMRSKDTVK